MYKLLCTLALLASFTTLTQAQTADSALIGSGYPNRAYYSFANGTVGTITNNNWDIAFANYPQMTASIRINGRFGVQLFQYTAGDTSAWATLDTAGLGALTGWSRNYDQDSTWLSSAFEANATGHPDYGWGTYNGVSHFVIGKSLFVIKLRSGGWKKIWIEQVDAASVYSVRMADLNGANDTVFEADKGALNNEMFLFYDLENVQEADADIDYTTHDLIFHAYEGTISPGMLYNVSGVLSSPGVEVAEVRNTHVDDADLGTAVFSENANIIGSDWKSFQGGWVIEDSLSYFVKNSAGNIYQVWFTGFSSQGKYFFNFRQVGFASVDEETTQQTIRVWPNPTTEMVQLHTPVSSEMVQVRIMDAQGKIYLQQLMAADSDQTIRTPYPAGIYYLCVSSEGKTQTTPFIVQ